ncbi:MAG: restriction endonuclease, partial [candidate division Zixibacteria bacterium]|nr:restriction endonuclease [candidate division Zixibacteria bacterium]
MSIPDYQEIMLPILKLASDNKEHSLSDAIKILADEFNLNSEERRELLPSGKQYKFNNRVGWARTYLKKAGLIASPERGIFKITERGHQVLSQTPKRIDNKFLLKYPEFQEFTGKRKETTILEDEQKVDTPEEIIESAFQEINESLASELLEKIKSSSDTFFERLVVELLIKMGYGGSRIDAGKAIGKSGDGGIDGIIKEDKLGLDII